MDYYHLSIVILTIILRCSEAAPAGDGKTDDVKAAVSKEEIVLTTKVFDFVNGISPASNINVTLFFYTNDDQFMKVGERMADENGVAKFKTPLGLDIENMPQGIYKFRYGSVKYFDGLKKQASYSDPEVKIPVKQQGTASEFYVLLVLKKDEYIAQRMFLDQ